MEEPAEPHPDEYQGILAQGNYARELLGEESVGALCTLLLARIKPPASGASDPPRFIAEAFVRGSVESVPPLMLDVRDALQALEDDQRGPAVRRAAVALYCLGACRLVQESVCRGADGLGLLPQDISEILEAWSRSGEFLCAVVATALFGGRIEFAFDSDGGRPLVDAFYRIESGAGASTSVATLEKALFQVLFESEADAPKQSLQDQDCVNERIQAKVKVRLAARKRNEQSVTLVVMADRELAKAFAQGVGAQVLVPAGDTMEIMSGIKREDFLAEWEEFEEVLALPGRQVNDGRSLPIRCLHVLESYSSDGDLRRFLVAVLNLEDWRRIWRDTFGSQLDSEHPSVGLANAIDEGLARAAQKSLRAELFNAICLECGDDICRRSNEARERGAL